MSPLTRNCMHITTHITIYTSRTQTYLTVIISNIMYNTTTDECYHDTPVTTTNSSTVTTYNSILHLQYYTYTYTTPFHIHHRSYCNHKNHRNCCIGMTYGLRLVKLIWRYIKMDPIILLLVRIVYVYIVIFCVYSDVMYIWCDVCIAICTCM